MNVNRLPVRTMRRAWTNWTATRVSVRINGSAPTVQVGLFFVLYNNTRSTTINALNNAHYTCVNSMITPLSSS